MSSEKAEETIVENKDDLQSAETASPKSEASPDPPTKETYRKKVWSHLAQNRLVNFPWPVYGRIPNFKGSDLAAAKLPEIPEFEKAVNIVVNPDKAQENARIIALELQKTLFVPVPKLADGLLKRFNPTEGAKKVDIKNLITQKGIEMCNDVVTLENKVEIDLMVVGSVAVSRDGYRIGKGKGYADLEFAMLMEMKAINENTMIVTIVHDSQVFDELPKDLFQAHDLPVDYIVTPTTVIKVPNRLPRPQGIQWKLLSNRRLKLMPLLQILKDDSEKSGTDVTLKEEDTDIEAYEPKRFFNNNYRRRFTKRRSPEEGKTSDSQGEENAPKEENPRPRRFYRRYYRRPNKTPKEQENKTDNTTSTSGSKDTPPVRKPVNKFQRFRPYGKRPKIDFSLMVSNIAKTVRVRDLKNALNERGIKPNDITWRGYRGFCFLHYAKPPVKENKEPTPPIIVDNVIEILQNLKICPESETNLSVKVMEPISRIETTDVTAV